MDQPWKLLVYISADYTLYTNALVSLSQLTDASSPDNVEIIVQLDGPTSDQVSRYKCSHGRKKLLWEAPNGYTNNRNQRLQHFLGFKEPGDTTPSSALNSEAARKAGQKIALILWGHGAGLDHVFIYSNPQAVEGSQTRKNGSSSRANSVDAAQAKVIDRLSGEDANLYVKNIQLGKTLSQFTKPSIPGTTSSKTASKKVAQATKTSDKIDLLGLDSCLMGMVEICHEFFESASLMVASDEEVPKGSWPYDTILTDLNKFPGMDASTLSTVIINRFLERYTQKGNKTRVSLTSMKLSASDDLVKVMKQLVQALAEASDPKKDVDGTVKRTIFRARDASRTPDEVTYIDFGVFCSELSLSSFPSDPIIPHLAKEVSRLLQKSSYILYHRDAGEDGSMDPYGLAIYFPETFSLTTAEINAVENAQPQPPAFTVGSKFAASNKDKFPASNKDKFDGPQITGYEILWPNYKELQFNQDTGWANLIDQLIGPLEKGKTSKAAAKASKKAVRKASYKASRKASKKAAQKASSKNAHRTLANGAYIGAHKTGNSSTAHPS